MLRNWPMTCTLKCSSLSAISSSNSAWHEWRSKASFFYPPLDSSQRRKKILARRSAQAVPVAVHSAALQASPDELKAAILLFYGLLDEQQRRLFAGLESIRLGHGGDTLLGDFLGLDGPTLAPGRQQPLDRNWGRGPTPRT